MFRDERKFRVRQSRGSHARSPKVVLAELLTSFDQSSSYFPRTGTLISLSKYPTRKICFLILTVPANVYFMCDILNLNAEVSAVKATTSSRAPNIPHRGNVQVQQRLKVKDRKMMDRTHSGSEYLLAEVRYPRTYRHEDKGKFTDYEIYIETNKIAFSRRTSTVRRRYSEFLWLRKQLASVEVNGLDKGSVPELPPKKVIGRFHPAFLTVRQQGLQHFLNSVMQINKFLSYSGLHLFLQSPMTIDEIEDFLEGKYGEKTVEDMLEDFGCATNTDNPFSIFLRSDPASLQILNNRPGRSVSYDRLTSTISQDDTHDDTVLSRSSVESSDMSSGSYTGVF